MSELHSRGSGGRGGSVWPFMVALIVAVALLVTASSSPRTVAPTEPTAASASPRPAKAAAPPDSLAGAQLRWLITAVAHLPISDAQVRAHFDQAFLAQISPAVLNQALAEVTGIKLLSIKVSDLSTIVANVAIGGGAAGAQVLVSVDGQGLVSWLRISPAAFGPTPATWADVDSALRSVAPQVHLLVGKVSSGSCQLVHSIEPDVAAPLGSAVKLYVLDALGNAVAARKVSWNQPLTVTARFKGLPPGELQNEPDGTQISVLDSAAKMISLSDNTAADMLTNLVGRPAVEAALATSGMANPALDLPFLTTREIYVLKLDQWPSLAQRYITADEPGRQALLASTVDRAPLPAVESAGAWTTPRDIDSLEYFASASDLCRVYASLATLAGQPGLAPIGRVLSLNDDGLQLDPAQWKTTWFKGGSEPGVLTLAFMATTRSGQSYVVTVLAENKSHPIDQVTAIPAILSAVKGAFTLAARR